MDFPRMGKKVRNERNPTSSTVPGRAAESARGGHEAQAKRKNGGKLEKKGVKMLSEPFVSAIIVTKFRMAFAA